MSVLDHKLRRDLGHSKGMLAAIIAIIVVGAGCLVGMLGTYDNLDMAKISYYSRCRMADFWVTIKKAPTQEARRRLADVQGVSDIRTRLSFPVVVDLEGVDTPLSGQALSLPDEPSPIINNIILRRGGYFTPNRRREVIVSERFAETREITPGSFIHLILNGQRKKLLVVGTAISSEYMYMTPPGSITPDPGGYGVFWLKRSFAEDVFGFHGACNSVVGLLTPSARTRGAPVMDRICMELNEYGVFTTTLLKDQLSNISLCSEMENLHMQATIMPTIFLGVAALVLNVVLTRMAEQQRVVIGTLKALGIGNRTILNHFVKFALFVGVVGGVGGCAFGYWIAESMTIMYQSFFSFPNLTNHVYPSLFILAGLISIVFAILGAWRGVKHVVGLNPAEAMRPPPPQSGEKTLIERWRAAWTRLDFRSQMVLRSLFRNKGRSIIGLIAAALGSSMLLLALGMADSMDYMGYFQFKMVDLSDYTIALRDDVDGGAVNEALALPGVNRAEPKLNVACDFVKGNRRKRGTITGLTHGATMTVPRNLKGDEIAVPPVGIVLTKRLAHILDVKAGDTVTFTPIKGVRAPHDVPVTGTVESMFGLPVYANYAYLNQLIGEEDAVSDIQLAGRLNEPQRTALFREVKKYPRLASLSRRTEAKKLIQTQFIDKIKSMTWVMIMFAAVIFFGSILNSSLISIAERQREIATFRVLGYHPTEVGSIFLREALLINMIGAVLGLPLGYYMLYAMAEQYQNDSFCMPCVVNPETWINSLILAFAFVIIAYLIIQRTINRLNWGEALKMKE